MATKYTIVDMRELARTRGGYCLSKIYHGCQGELQWKCARGHTWWQSLSNIRKYWCAQCAALDSRLTLEELKQTAQERGGACLSTEYETNKTLMEWRCAHGHVWQTSASNIRQGRWCRQCAVARRRNTIEEVQEFARRRGGACLSTEYKNGRLPLTWVCQKNHKWEAPFNSVRTGHWCSFCAHVAKRTIEELRNIAIERGGQCLSEKYKNGKTPVLMECQNLHQWKAKPDQIFAGTWCPRCAGRGRTIDDMEVLAAKRGGKCLSAKYLGARGMLEWRCSEGHKWQALADSVKRGSWCPHCTTNYGEEICRLYFEAFFRRKFPRTRPEFLRTKSGSKLELDGYCSELKIAFEHHGGQHYLYKRQFHMSLTALDKLQKRDAEKIELCKKAEVVLIVIPEIGRLTEVERVPDFILTRCAELGIEVPFKLCAGSVDLASVYGSSPLLELQTIAEKNGGRCVSTVYLGANVRLSWQCSAGHEWRAIPISIKRGSWCRKCKGLEKHSIADMHELARSRGGKCLSDIYVDARTPLAWQCGSGHIWDTIPGHIRGKNGKPGSWCPFCANRVRRTIEEMRLLAASRDGECLSAQYINGQTKLVWRCSFGHEWQAIPTSVKRGTWCPVCMGKKPKLT